MAQRPLLPQALRSRTARAKQRSRRKEPEPVSAMAPYAPPTMPASSLCFICGGRGARWVDAVEGLMLWALWVDAVVAVEGGA